MIRKVKWLSCCAARFWEGQYGKLKMEWHCDPFFLGLVLEFLWALNRNTRKLHTANFL